MAEDSNDKKMMATEVNLEELMEVVTSYKCRFCNFTCSSVPEMSSHLQKTHISTSSTASKSTSPLAVEVEEEAGLKSSNTLDPDLACGEEEEEEDGQAGEEMPALLSNLGLTPIAYPGNPGLVIKTSLPDPKVLTNQVRKVAKHLPILASSPQSDLGLFSMAAAVASTQSMTPMTSLQLTGGGLMTLAATTAVAAGDALSLPLVAATASNINNKDLGTGPSSIAPITRELFLCGVCSVGFISVDECKYHMEKEHNAAPDPAHVSDTVIDKYDQRVSIGTQATGKRPGRKRKSEMPEPSSVPARRVKEEAEEENNDEDWLPGRHLSAGTRDGKQRRKIRTPKALREDYVTDKKRKYRKRRMVIKESYTLACSYLGCSTKFRCKESLDIHLDCHNKEDDAFTCHRCPLVFEVWKPLRIHLWRSHAVDCDMFQCDLCEYKTDTLHKLGVHCEIHSDKRPYTCDVCGKGFKQLSQMKNHQIIHEEHQRAGRDTWFSNKTCEVCKRTFANSKCLKKHVEAVHGQNKPFKCQYCGHTTAWKAMLILHERTHTGEKPFKCDVCKYATGDHNSLRRHKMRHTGQRQYKCQLCAYTCIQTISLKTHMRSKHPNAEGVVYLCQLCKFRTINKQIYANHLVDHRHGLLPETPKEEAPPPPPLPPQPQPPAARSLTVETASLPPMPEGSVQLQLQVKKMDTGELHANKEDIDRLNGSAELISCGMDANQLIYSALNIGSQNNIGAGLTYTAQLLNGMQCTVAPAVPASKDVLSAYLITFMAPPLVEPQPLPAGHQTIIFQSLAEAGVSVLDAVANQDQDDVSQTQEGAEDGGMTLAEVTQADGMTLTEVAQSGGMTLTEVTQAEGITLTEVSQAGGMEQVTQILYAQGVEAVHDARASHEDPQDRSSSVDFHQVMQVSGENSTGVEEEEDDDDDREVKEESEDFSGVSEVVSAAGLKGVLLAGSGFVVMEAAQGLDRVLVVGPDHQGDGEEEEEAGAGDGVMDPGGHHDHGIHALVNQGQTDGGIDAVLNPGEQETDDMGSVMGGQAVSGENGVVIDLGGQAGTVDDVVVDQDQQSGAVDSILEAEGSREDMDSSACHAGVKGQQGDVYSAVDMEVQQLGEGDCESDVKKEEEDDYHSQQVSAD